MALVLVTPPAAEPVTLAEAKAHARVDITDDDAYITALIIAAREQAEDFTRRVLITQTWDYFRDDWPGADTLEIPKPPLGSVTSIKYTDEDGNQSTFNAANYVVDPNTEPGRVRLKSGASWPSVTLKELGGVEVRFTAGYGDPGNVPQRIKQAIMLAVGHWYENREAVTDTRGGQMILPMGFKFLLWPFRVFTL